MADNLSKHIFDLTMENELSSTDQPLRYGIDYDYIVESFFCEYKLDVKELKSVQAQFRNSTNPDEQKELIDYFHSLYPECTTDNIASIEIPETIIKKAFFVQSPKGYDGLPSIHYSLKEKMLSDFRANRSKVKKEMEKAAEAGDLVGEVRYNAKQLAIKVVCNSEYGASNNEYFAHYDPDIAAAVTYASRSLIAFLTSVLESHELYVDEKFLRDNKQQLEALRNIDCLSIEPAEHVDLFAKRRNALRRMFDDSYNVICKHIFKINIKPSTVCYQDTDSNYYKNTFIADYYTKDDEGNIYCSPEVIDLCMHSLLSHNELIANFAKACINRRPYALSFEGAFIICRYLNRKKKYYGIKWGDDAELRLGYKLDPAAYDEYGILTLDYLPYWKPKKTVLPQPNGEYIYLDIDKLLNQGVNYLDYIRGQNVKCTGVDLARRDQYKFINFYHMVVLQKDLRLMKYLGGNEWHVFKENEPMEEVIDNIIESFRVIIERYTDMSTLTSDVKPEIGFKAIDFAKTGAYRQGKLNAVSTIVRRLKREGKEQYIPTIGERTSYITILDEKTKEERLQGKNNVGRVADRSYVIEEVFDMLRDKYPEHDFNEMIKEKQLKITYDEYINARAMCMLDFKYYLECLCKSMALYLIGDLYPDIVKNIDDGMMDAKSAGVLITKLQADIAKKYVEKYFHAGKDVSQSINKYNKLKRQYATVESKKGIDLLFTMYPRLRECKEISRSVCLAIIKDADENIEKYTKVSTKMMDLYKSLVTDFFNKYVSDDGEMKRLYDKYENDPEQLMRDKFEVDKRLATYQIVKDLAMNMKFE